MTAPQGLNGWANTARFPNESSETALRRRVKMHEFLMSGGVYLGIDPETGRALYSELVDPATAADEYPDCPWHGTDPDGTKCSAWEAIITGRGTGEPVSPTLTELRNLSDEELQDARARIRVARDQKDGIQTWMPGENPRREFPPLPARGGGNKMSWYDDPGASQHRSAEPSIEDARDTAMEHLGESIPDTIEIEGDEEDED